MGSKAEARRGHRHSRLTRRQTPFQIFGTLAADQRALEPPFGSHRKRVTFLTTPLREPKLSVICHGIALKGSRTQARKRSPSSDKRRGTARNPRLDARPHARMHAAASHLHRARRTSNHPTPTRTTSTRRPLLPVRLPLHAAVCASALHGPPPKNWRLQQHGETRRENP